MHLDAEVLHGPKLQYTASTALLRAKKLNINKWHRIQLRTGKLASHAGVDLGRVDTALPRLMQPLLEHYGAKLSPPLYLRPQAKL